MQVGSMRILYDITSTENDSCVYLLIFKHSMVIPPVMYASLVA